ncbi:MAG: porin family protein [Tepidiformaceae bacterium]
MLGALLLPRAAPAQVIISLLFGDALNTGRVEFGLDGGLNFASLRGPDDAGSLRTWNLGFYFDIRLDNPAWLIHTGVIVKSTMGAEDQPPYPLGDGTLDSLFAGGNVTTRLRYFNVPVMLKYRMPNHFFVEGGGMAGLLYEATDEFLAAVEDEDDLTHERDVEDDYDRLDAGIIVGAGYRLFGGNGMNLGVRYYHGLVDVGRDGAAAERFNRSVYLTVGIPIGAGEEEAGEAR